MKTIVIFSLGYFGVYVILGQISDLLTVDNLLGPVSGLVMAILIALYFKSQLGKKETKIDELNEEIKELLKKKK